MMTESVEIGVIGGSGLYKMPEISDKVSVAVDTPYGTPSANIVIGTLRGKRVAFIPRHGIGHVYTPSTVPYRANIYALKTLGVKFILGVNACGSLREDYQPGQIVIPDQLFDNTKADRGRSFFDTGMVAHISIPDPFCPHLSDLLAQAVGQVGGTAHRGGTFVIIEGPRFSTKGESHIFRQWGCSIVGMTACPEAFLAREAEIAYASMAHITDFDVWHTTEEPVTTQQVIETLQHNIITVQGALAQAIENLDTNMHSDAHDALSTALLTDRTQVSNAMLEKLKPLVGRYIA